MTGLDGPGSLEPIGALGLGRKEELGGGSGQNDPEMVKLSVRGRYGTLEGGFSVASPILYL